jgi:RNA polymerase sigma-70 factor (ECF subfamily)
MKNVKTIPSERPVADFGTQQDVLAELAALGDADTLRIHQIAKMRSFGLAGVTWEDLLQEAIARSIQGTRRWPRDVPFVAFLAQTLRSVANEEWRRRIREPVSLEADLPSGPDGEVMEMSDLETESIGTERIVMARQILTEIDSLFEGDHHALAVIRGLANGQAPEEIQAEAGITATEYSSTQRRIRRALARRFLAKDSLQ